MSVKVITLDEEKLIERAFASIHIKYNAMSKAVICADTNDYMGEFMRAVFSPAGNICLFVDLGDEEPEHIDVFIKLTEDESVLIGGCPFDIEFCH